MPKHHATASDVEIGKRIRIRRRQLGMSQMELAAKLGVAYQQVQKYERGTNRVSASRLPHVAAALEVRVGFFYGHDDVAAGVDTEAVAGTIGLLTERHAIELLECFQAMTAPQRNALMEIAKALAAANAVMEAAASDGERGDDEEGTMWLLDRLACLIGWHSPWNTGGDEVVCLECGRSISVRAVSTLPVVLAGRSPPAAAAR